MGLFDFLKNKKSSTPQSTSPTNPRQECDINGTYKMVELFNVPRDQRDDNWRQTFLDDVQSASFACADPQVSQGPDGFPYFVLNTPEPGKAFQSFCIRNMKDDFLLEKGFGVAINPNKYSAEWVFSHGDIVNLHLNGEFYSRKNHPDLPGVEIIQKAEKVLVAQPSESFLPKATRKALKSFLQYYGIQNPKLLMICRAVDRKVIQELAFNIFLEDFSSPEHLQERQEQISWFLPKHYTILSIPRNSDLADSFEDL